MKNKMTILTMGVVLSFTLVQFAVAKQSQLKDYGDGTCLDNKTGIIWQVDKSRRYSDKQGVSQYLTKLNEGEHKDWHLPTMDELKALRKVFDKHKNGDCDLKRPNSWYWADKSPFIARPGKLEENDECGGGYEFVAKAKGAVRAVQP